MQDEEGQHFYLVDSGTLDCFVKSNDPAHLVRVRVRVRVRVS